MKILYATDGSEGALTAGRLLERLPFGAEASIHIITVVDEDKKQSGVQHLETAREALGAFSGRITTAVAHARSTSVIVEALLWAAEYLDADLIAVGAQGHSALARFFLGSVAEGLARHADIPVLMVRSGGLPPRKVIIGVDGSADAHHAACWVYTRMPLPPDCKLCLVRAVQTPVWAAYPDSMLASVSEEVLREAVAAGRAQAQEYLGALGQELRGYPPDHPVEDQVRVGAPAAALKEVAIEQGAGLIVVGSRGVSGLERFLLGSVSADIIHHAPCSVLVVPHVWPATEGVSSSFDKGTKGTME